MGHEVTIGGERLGSGKKNKAYLHHYERSTHDMGYVWRSTMASGTLVPFMTEIALPGDTFDIDLNMDVLTHPTIGPLFGTYKVEAHVFQIPMRLYQRELHMNTLEIGRNMSQIKFPKIEIQADTLITNEQIDNQQINPSCILSYLGIRGLGYPDTARPTVTRRFNAIPYLGYWDIYKNYYANKQEEIGAVIHKRLLQDNVVFTSANITQSIPNIAIPLATVPPWVFTETTLTAESVITLIGTGIDENFDPTRLIFRVKTDLIQNPDGVYIRATTLMKNWEVDVPTGTIIGTGINDAGPWGGAIPLIWPTGFGGVGYLNNPIDVINDSGNTEPQIKTFPLNNIDEMRRKILTDITAGLGVAFVINDTSIEPFNLPLLKKDITNLDYPKRYGQEGLALKTYNSDLFNNWISTEWIDGVDGISQMTAIDTSGGSFTIDELNMSKKVYEMLNRIALSGGSYDDWLDAVYTHDRQRSIENPIYLGGLIQNLVFQEVISNTSTANQPLGTLAGRGTMGQKRKGGNITVKIDEPSYLMGIVSITPNIDYSQGNKWDTTLDSMNDLHKPALDEIGFQDLVTDQMAWFDTAITTANQPVYKSAGKQPAWINYMTNVNQVRGNFADQAQQMFMTLNRRYQAVGNGTGGSSIKDLTTYIDPSKFNHIFADTRRDAQNFWTQIGVNMTARRKMSAKVIPNL